MRKDLISIIVLVMFAPMAANADLVILDRAISREAVSDGRLVEENFDGLPIGTILGDTPDLSYDASQGDVIVTNSFLTSTFPNGIGSTSIGFFLPTESASFSFSSPITAFAIDINTFAATDGAYSASLNNGTTVSSAFEAFPNTTTGQFLGFLSDTPFSEVTISAITGFSYTLDTLLYGDASTIDPLGTSPQIANVFSAWKKSIEWGQENDNATERWESLQDCVDDPSCDIDEAYAEEQAIVQEGAELLTDTAIKTGELNFDAVPVPTNKAETILFAIQKGLDFLLNLFYGDDQGASVSESSVNATEGEFSINPDFAFYEGYADIWLDNYIDELLLDQMWINDYAGFSGYENYLGVFEITEIQGQRLRVSFQQLESTRISVPEPTTLALLCVGLIGMVVSRRRKKAL